MMKQFILVLLATMVILVSGCSPVSITAKTLTFEAKWRDPTYGFLTDMECSLSSDLADWEKEPGLISGYRIHMSTLRTSHRPFDEIEQVVEIYQTEEMAKKAFAEWKKPSKRLRFSGLSASISFPLNLPQIGDESKSWTIDYEEWEANVYVVVFRKGKILEGIAVDYTSFNVLDQADWFASKKTKKEWFIQLVREAEEYIK